MDAKGTPFNFVEDFDVERFGFQLEKGVVAVSDWLQVTRASLGHHHKLPPSSYEQLYIIVSVLTNYSLASLMNCLEFLGITEDQIEIFQNWYKKGSSISLRFISDESCTFMKKEKREKKTPKVVKEESAGVLKKKKTTTYVSQKVTDYFWKFECKYSLVAFRGNDRESPIVIFKESQTKTLKTSIHESPYPQTTTLGPYDLDITWLFSVLQDGTFEFRIDRSLECLTPYYNESVDEALDFFSRFFDWGHKCIKYFVSHLLIEIDDEKSFSSVDTRYLFFPFPGKLEEMALCYGEAINGLLEQ